MAFEIDKGVRLPAKQNRRAYTGKYPWRQMETGDSFYVPFNDEPHGRVRSRLSGGACVMRKQYGLKFTTRLDGDGIRVWRVE